MKEIQNIKRFILTSDWHFGCHSNQKKWLHITHGYFKNFFIPWLRKNIQPGDVVLMLGDVYENRQSIDQEVDDTAFKVIEEISTICPIWILIGNHDIYKKSTNKINALSNKFKYVKNVKIFEDPEKYKIDSRVCLFMPWRKDKEHEKRTLEEYGKGDYLFCHTDFQGAKYNKYVVIEDGLDITSTYYKRVYSGHIHLRQTQFNGKLTFVGCPYQITRNDRGNVKGHWILNIKSGETEFVENTYSPKYVMYDLKEISNNYQEPLGNLIEKVKNNFVDLYIDGNLIAETNLIEIINYLGDYVKHIEPFFYQNGYDYEEIEKEINENYNFGEDLNILSLIHKQISNMNYNEMIKNKLNRYMIKLHENAKNDT